MISSLYLLSTATIAAESYLIPPSSSTYEFVPVISDEKMEQCVKIYNESEWLYKRINETHVDNSGINLVCNI